MDAAASGSGVDEEPIGILLLGVTGHGKSATGNSILGRRQFLSRGGGASVTKEYHVGYTEFEGRTLKVVDVPGFQDTEEDTYEKKVELVCKALTSVLTKFPEGFHTVLLVVSYGSRMTSEMKSSMIALVKLFDEQAFKMNGILLMTYGDSFLRDFPDGDVARWLSREVNPENRWTLEACGNRCVLFDNITEDEEKQRSQKLKLLSAIDEIGRNSDIKYIPKIGKLNEADRKRMIQAKEKAIGTERIDCLIGMLKDNLYKMPRTKDHVRQVEMIAQLITDARYIKNNSKELPSEVSKNLSAFIEKLEEVRLTNRMDAVVEMDLNEIINQMQINLKSGEESDGEESWWQYISKNVGKAISSEIGQKVITFFLDIAKNKLYSFLDKKKAEAIGPRDG